MADTFQPLRDQLMRALDWDEAHVEFEKAMAGIPADRRGARAPGFPHSLWELLEHMRIAQRDLLDFCVNAQYVHAMAWPDDYWPREKSPSDDAWNASVASVRADRAALQRVIGDPSFDLFAPVPTGTARQTCLRSILLVIDHNAYHLGQLVAVRHALGIWP